MDKEGGCCLKKILFHTGLDVGADIADFEWYCATVHQVVKVGAVNFSLVDLDAVGTVSHIGSTVIVAGHAPPLLKTPVIMCINESRVRIPDMIGSVSIPRQLIGTVVVTL